MQSGQSDPANMPIVKIIALAMLLLAPVAYLAVGFVLDGQGVEAKAGGELVLYILLIMSLVEPLIGMIVEGAAIRNFRSNRGAAGQPEGLFLTVSLAKMALVEAVYIFGLVTFLVTGKFVYMLYFYPIGIAWSVVYWPKREKYERLVEKLNQP